MIPLKAIIAETKKAFPNSQLRYLYPTLYLVCEDDAFARLNEEQRRSVFFQRTALQQPEAELALQSSGVVLSLVVPAEGQVELAFMAQARPSHHWIEFLANPNALPQTVVSAAHSIIHFYGFKGGQARSTILGMTAQHLANDGYRVLVVDADAEAPSLPSVFGVPITVPEATLFGCAQLNLNPKPQPVFIPRSAGGRIDMLACKLDNPDYDLDFAAFALRLTLDPNVTDRLFAKIATVARVDYDVVLVDHRSGLSTTVLPIAAGYPGPVVVCLRLDEQSAGAEGFFEVLFRQNKSAPGLFVSFSLDPDENRETMMGRNRGQVESLLNTLSSALARGADPVIPDDPEAPAPDDLLEYWVPWFHDRSFLSSRLPPIENISTDNVKSLVRLRELIGLSAKKHRPIITPSLSQSEVQPPQAQLTSSGNTDQGLLIETETLRKLRLPNSRYNYILGRKGTGKTRLLRALVESHQGEPMLVADDFIGQEGIQCSDPLIKDLTDRLGTSNAEKFWWVLLDSKLSGPGRTVQADRLQQWLKRIAAAGPSVVSATEIARNVSSIDGVRTFLIDGVETAFNSAQIAKFVEGLFQFLSAVQSNEQFNRKITVRLFIRTDLARRAYENIEQQIEGRSLQLSWDTQGILNFVLSRIVDQPWYRKHFPVVVDHLDTSREQLATGAMPEAECSSYLLAIFPEQLRRNNLQTLTFLKTYFSDGVGDRASYYPRVYDTFLQDIAEPGRISLSYERASQIEEGHVAQPLIIAAHDHASRDYLQQVASELNNLLRLSDEPDANKNLVDSLIESFRGMPTPFEVGKCIDQLVEKLPNITSSQMREAMNQMKQVGIFEERPDYPGWWRVGRLFKSSLGMKYFRAPPWSRSSSGVGLS